MENKIAKGAILRGMEALTHQLLGINYEKFVASGVTKNRIVDILDGDEPNTFFFVVNTKWLLDNDDDVVVYTLLQKTRLIYQSLQIFNLKEDIDCLKYIEDRNLVLAWLDEMSDGVSPMLTRQMFIDSLAFTKIVYEKLFEDKITVPEEIIDAVNDRMVIVEQSFGDKLDKSVRTYKEIHMISLILDSNHTK